MITLRSQIAALAWMLVLALLAGAGLSYTSAPMELAPPERLAATQSDRRGGDSTW